MFPLNSVQSQYQHTILNDLQIDEKYVNVINSDSLFKINNSKDTEEEKGIKITNNNLWLFERNCFSSELIITSHVRFFETLAAITRKSSLGFLSLINSVVIIDEFQNYPSKHWESIWSDLLIVSKVFGVKWIFTTGTFPLSKEQLETVYGTSVKYVLSEEENESLFCHPSVKNRCEISLLSNSEYESTRLLGHDILHNMLQVQYQHTQFIICVSYVRHSKEIYHYLESKLRGCGYKVYFLCGRHSNSYKREIMRCINHHNKKENRKDKIVLVTTKTVECGMDFDFDYGYKEFDMFDSVEQLSGRVNRSGYRDENEVKLFYLSRRKYEKEKLYHRDDEVIEKLRNKQFRTLYEEMYSHNKISLAKRKQVIDKLHVNCNINEYSSSMTIIENEDYSTDVYFIREREEEDFVKKNSRNKP